MEHTVNKKKNNIFAPFANTEKEMTPEEVEQFMQKWPDMVEELEKNEKNEEKN